MLKAIDNIALESRQDCQKPILQAIEKGKRWMALSNVLHKHELVQKGIKSQYHLHVLSYFNKNISIF